jgi:2-C-methyl-D-erythritol 4-phosphate cytidylyltransferase
MKVIVIIPAAGLGTRMGSSTAISQGRQRSKQFVELEGAPILIHTLRKFTSSKQVDEVWVAMRKTELDAFAPELEDAKLPKPVHTVEGGEHRQQSVANALNAVKAAEDDIILVHDAVRPFIDGETIDAAIEAVKKHGAIVVGVPAIDTIKHVERTADGAVVKTTIPREQIVQAQTPQGARYGILKKVFDEAEASEFLGTDEASLLERAGYPVHVVMGSTRNIKITTPADRELAEFFLSSEHRRDVVTG